jgi:cell division protein FtsX
MLKVFQRHVASVFKGMLQTFVQNISSVLDVCCKHFLSGCCTCFTYCVKSMFEIFQQFQSYVAISVFVLQVFYLDVTYISYKSEADRSGVRVRSGQGEADGNERA